MQSGKLSLIFEVCIFMEGAVKNLSKFDIRISYVFIRLILPAFFFEVASSTKNVEQE